jgi:chaperone BCS1
MFLDTARAILASNQLLVGGVGTLAFGSAMWLLRAVPEKALELVERTLWTKVSVESFSNEFGDVDGFVEANRLDFFSRSLEIKDGRLKTGFGGGWGTYLGTLFKYAKAKSAQQVSPYETITVSFLSRDRGLVERFLQDCKPEEHRNSLYVSIYSANGFSGGVRRRKRGLDTVFVDAAIKDRLVRRLTWFLGAESWHAARGIPWKFGVVLHGPPGTGKTSLIHALASDLGFDIKYVKSLQGLGAAFLTGGRRDLFVIEDIDTISGALHRDAAPGGGHGEAGGGGAPLHELLNAMDGLQTPDGLKFIVTTNHLDRLDPAIVRPGRIDEAIEIGPLSRDSAREMFAAFYGREGIMDYAPRTGAELQRIFSTMSAEEAEEELARGAAARQNSVPAAERAFAQAS